ncbi:MAG: hypothetical protein QNJ81_02250 [Acidimicrobiia bacterium]|nr:hypothetical protein [Acidimicrobiia bacterium]
MAFVTDPDDLAQGVEVVITPAARTIQLQAMGSLADPGTKASDNGVTGQCLYSFLKEEWRTDANLIKFPFPMVAITPEQFEFIEDWVPADDTTRNFIRNAGWVERTAADAIEREYIGVISLGTIDDGDTPYYFFSSQTSATSFAFDGPANQAIQTFGDATNGNFDYRTDILTTNIRIFGKLYGSSNTVAIGIASGATLPTNAQRFPLSEAADLKINQAVTDSGAMDATDLLNNYIITMTPQAPFNDMDIEYFGMAQSRAGFVPIAMDGGSADFGVIIDQDVGVQTGGPGTAEQLYAFVQAQLQDTADIDAGAGNRVGLLQDPLVEFVGDNLRTVIQSVANAPAGGRGVAIDNFNTNDTNRLTFIDNLVQDRTFPFVSAGSILFNNNLQNEPVGQATFWMFFTDAGGNQYGTAAAIIVDNNSGVDITGDIDGATSFPFDFDYDGNSQGGRTPGTDAAITIVAIGTAVAQFVVATGTITRSVGQAFSLVAALERNYLNPV